MLGNAWYPRHCKTIKLTVSHVLTFAPCSCTPKALCDGPDLVKFGIDKSKCGTCWYSNPNQPECIFPQAWTAASELSGLPSFGTVNYTFATDNPDGIQLRLRFVPVWTSHVVLIWNLIRMCVVCMDAQCSAWPCMDVTTLPTSEAQI